MEENKEKKTVNVSMGGFTVLIISLVLLILVVGVGIGIFVTKSMNKDNTAPATPAEQNTAVEENKVNTKTEQTTEEEEIKLGNHIKSEFIGIEFDCPVDWYDKTQAVAETLISNINFDNEGPVDYSKTVMIETCSDQNKKETPKQYLEDYLGNNKKAQLVEEGKIVVDGIEGYYGITNDKEIPGFEKLIYIKKGSTIYSIFYWGGEDIFNKYSSTFDAILKTVKFSEPVQDIDN